MSSEEEFEFECTPPEVKSAATAAINNLLPTKSRPRYESTFSQFVKWCEDKKIKNYSENVLVAYFEEIGSTKKTLWPIYSMIRSCLNIKKNIDISKYPKLLALLKRKTEHHIPKKSQILEGEHITKFLTEAPNKEYFLMKTILIMGISGACRREEICKMMIGDVIFKDDIILVSIPIGINTIGKIPSLIAKYLELPNPHQYTGHCFRRSSATLLANKGLDFLAVKRHGGWKSSAVAEGYIQDSLKNKIEVADTLTDTEPVRSNSNNSYNISNAVRTENTAGVSGVSFASCSN